MADRLVFAQRPLGRWVLEALFAWKQLAWRLSLAADAFLKRALDLVVCVAGLLVLWPLMLLVGLLIKLEDGGPMLYVQTRVGKRGREFKMLKFRSMSVNSDDRVREFFARNKHARGVTFKIQNDPRLTRMGRLIRRFSLDELPQLINIVKGDMTLVGPRPPLPREVKLYSAFERRRLEVTPGLTCFWQIGGRSDVDFPDQVRMDLQYIQTRSFRGDLKILFKTVPAVLTCRGAY